MNRNIHNAILQFTGASRFEEVEVIQSLWSGYGKIVRLRLFDADLDTVVVKYVSLPDSTQHPRGWNTDLSHQRKIRSYQVESQWYTHYAKLCDYEKHCDASCRVAACLGALEDGDQFIMVLEDLDAAGFSGRLDYSVDIDEELMLLHMRSCIEWLANFHARFLQLEPSALKNDGLWQEGSYWHLATRPDEYAALPEGRLKRYAGAIDTQLAMCPWQTLIHGDAKLANFCFAENRDQKTSAPQVAAVDFQYVGSGCGMKDVAYFISSCLDEEDCERLAPKLLDDYFAALRQALANYQKALSATEVDQLEQTWRDLYPFAWADFYRFLQGWSPSHWKMHSYSEKLTQRVLSRIEQLSQTLDASMPALLHTAIQAAQAAAEVIAEYRDQPVDIMHKGLGGSKVSDVVTEVDLQCQALIASRLAPACEQFGIAFIGEESEDHSARLNAEYSWLVDPIDGTLPFIEQREGYAVSIGLINRAGEPLLGVVLDAYHQKLYAAAKGCESHFAGAELEQRAEQESEQRAEQAPEQKAEPEPERSSSSRKIRCFLDAGYLGDSRYEPVFIQLHEYAIAHGFEGIERVVGLGGVLNACRLLESGPNEAPSLYLKLPKDKGGSIWDYAASAAIFTQQGLPVSDIFGEPLDLNRKDSTYLNHRGVLYASDAGLAEFVIDKLIAGDTILNS